MNRREFFAVIAGAVTTSGTLIGDGKSVYYPAPRAWKSASVIAEAHLRGIPCLDLNLYGPGLWTAHFGIKGLPKLDQPLGDINS